MNKEENSKNKKQFFTLAEIIFIALFSAVNVVVDILVSPAFKAIFSHIVAGVLIMVPVNFLFLTITKKLVPKFGTLTIYFLVFSAISIPTSLFGGTAGPYKLVVGLVLGLCLDIAFLPKKTIIQILLGSIGGSIAWWFSVFTVWQLFDLPFVLGFSNLLNSASPIYNGTFDFSGLMTLPITGFGIDFVLFSLFCGLMSALPVLIAVVISVFFYKKIEKTAVYTKFKGLR